MKCTYLLDGVIAYSYFPIRCMSGIGVIVAVLGFLYAMIVFGARLLGGIPVQGWAAIATHLSSIPSTAVRSRKIKSRRRDFSAENAGFQTFVRVTTRVSFDRFLGNHDHVRKQR